jgi:hypothetical protein
MAGASLAIAGRKVAPIGVAPCRWGRRTSLLCEVADLVMPRLIEVIESSAGQTRLPEAATDSANLADVKCS